MPDPDRIIRLPTVLARTGLSRSTLYRKIAEGTFPAQLRISIHGAGWRESEIDRWVANPVGWRPEGEGRQKVTKCQSIAHYRYRRSASQSVASAEIDVVAGGCLETRRSAL